MNVLSSEYLREGGREGEREGGGEREGRGRERERGGEREGEREGRGRERERGRGRERGREGSKDFDFTDGMEKLLDFTRSVKRCTFTRHGSHHVHAI